MRSQVLPYLRGLIERGASIELVTFERGATLFPADEFPPDHWHALRARASRSLLAKALDILAGILVVAGLARATRADLIHARSYLPAAIGLVAGLIARTPFIFDMRGFLPDEYVEGGNWRAGELRDRALRAAERVLLARAAEIVVLTDAAAARLRREPQFSRWVSNKEVTAIPCAVDLDLFRPREPRSDVPTLLYSGSLGLWYLLDEMLRVYAVARDRVRALRFLFLSRGERSVIVDAARRLGLEGADIRVGPVPYERMPEQVARAHVGIILLRQVSSKSGSSAVKTAEYLASGLPVVVDRGHGDVAGWVHDQGAGVVMDDYSDAEIQRAGDAVARLVSDEAARSAARHLAEAKYDLRSGVAAYAGIYSRLTRERGDDATHLGPP